MVYDLPFQNLSKLHLNELLREQLSSILDNYLGEYLYSKTIVYHRESKHLFKIEHKSILSHESFTGII